MQKSSRKRYAFGSLKFYRISALLLRERLDDTGIIFLYRQCIVRSDAVAGVIYVSICLCLVAERILVLVSEVLEYRYCVGN